MAFLYEKLFVLFYYSYRDNMKGVTKNLYKARRFVI